MECSGEENGLLECLFEGSSNEAVTDCDSRETAAAACQGKISLLCRLSHGSFSFTAYHK